MQGAIVFTVLFHVALCQRIFDQRDLVDGIRGHASFYPIPNEEVSLQNVEKNEDLLRFPDDQPPKPQDYYGAAALSPDHLIDYFGAAAAPQRSAELPHFPDVDFTPDESLLVEAALNEGEDPDSLLVPSSLYQNDFDSSDEAMMQYLSRDEDGSLRYGYQYPGTYHTVSQDPQNNMEGSYSYVTPDGDPIKVTYTAGEQGFQASGSHFPKAPLPIYEPHFAPDVQEVTRLHLQAHKDRLEEHFAALEEAGDDVDMDDFVPDETPSDDSEIVMPDFAPEEEPLDDIIVVDFEIDSNDEPLRLSPHKVSTRQAVYGFYPQTFHPYYGFPVRILPYNIYNPHLYGKIGLPSTSFFAHSQGQIPVAAVHDVQSPHTDGITKPVAHPQLVPPLVVPYYGAAADKSAKAEKDQTYNPESLVKTTAVNSPVVLPALHGQVQGSVNVPANLKNRSPFPGIYAETIHS